MSFMCTAKIPQGYAGIVYNVNGGVEDGVLGQGWHILAPWKSVTKYPASTEMAYYNASKHEGRSSDDSIVIGTKDGKTIKIDMQISYHIATDKMSHVFNKFRGQGVDSIEYGYMRQNVQRIINDVSSQYSIVEINGSKKPEFNQRVLNTISEFLLEDGIVVEQAGIGNIGLDDQTKAVIQGVANAQYAKEQAEYEKAAAIAQAQTQIEKARGNAEALKMESDAQAYANQKLAQSTDSRVVELEWIKKWDGKLPQYQLGSGTSMMMQMK